MKYKVITLIIAGFLAGCGSEDASNVNSVIDNLQEDDETQDEQLTPTSRVETTTTTTVYGQPQTQTQSQSQISQPSASQESTTKTATSGSGGLPASAVLSFNVSPMDWECSDYTFGTTPEQRLEMQVSINEGWMQAAQTARQLASGEQQRGMGTQIIESTPLSGPIEPDGEFSLTGTTVMMDISFGMMRARYNLNGEMTAAGWSGDYEYSVYIEDYFTTCIYSGRFSGRIK